MNKPFISEDFLLETDAARALFHDYAKELPIIDYHCHLSPEEIAQDRRWKNLAQIWLAGDHYKWRAMRANGVAEHFCTGTASDWEKFEQWAQAMPYLLRNPLYHWTHMELKNYFGISDRLLSPETAKSIWEEARAVLSQDGFSARGLLKQSKVVLICTTDDPVDHLEHHKVIAADKSFEVKVLPAWRPDKAMATEDVAAFNAWVNKLAKAAGAEVRDFNSYLKALRQRHNYFHSMGCRLSDQGVETIYAADYSEREITKIFAQLRAGSTINPEETLKFKSALLYEFALMNYEKGWAQQFHYGALRNNNSRMWAVLGPDAGFDSMSDGPVARVMSRFFDRLDKEGQLARTIVYNLNPADNELVAAMICNFQDGSVPGKMQMGSAWWFLDQKDGLERQIETLSQLGLLSRFVGMLTDSRSFLSCMRHEYFRRILCNILGRDIEKGLIPDDMKPVGRMVKDICYQNAADYFGFDLMLHD